MVWGWDAYLVMTMRQQFGYTLGAIGVCSRQLPARQGDTASRRGGVQSA